MKRTAVVLAVVSILLCAVLPASLALPSNSSQQVTQGQSTWQTFGGRVVSQNQVRFVLKDYENDTWYHIDDQQKAASFVGKNVLITGAFDGLTGTIRVQNIVEATPEQVSAANIERIKQNTPPPPPPKSLPPPAVAANTPSGAPQRANPPQRSAAPPLEARRTPPVNETRRPAPRTEAPASASRPVAAPSPAISLPEEAVSASSTVAISSRRSIAMPHSVGSQNPPPKDLVVGRLLRKVSPSYPVQAKQQGIEGTVRVHAVIGADGNIQSVQPVSGPEPLVGAAVTAVREWRYGPTLFEGRRVPVHDDISFVFRLPD
ncbi:MAG TPA: TonB family protein [Candidatus Dormibacteraeota bacterium]|nr:TonB family protein [Candidatus Dormibacteraeota bacterium]